MSVEPNSCTFIGPDGAGGWPLWEIEVSRSGRIILASNRVMSTAEAKRYAEDILDAVRVANGERPIEVERFPGVVIFPDRDQ